MCCVLSLAVIGSQAVVVLRAGFGSLGKELLGKVAVFLRGLMDLVGDLGEDFTRGRFSGCWCV